MRQYEGFELFKKLLPIAQVAGNAVIAVYAKGSVSTTLKDDQSPMTQADLAAHQVLVQLLQRLLPNTPVASEEAEGSHAHRSQTGRFWLIDPLDGTKEFISGSGEFTVNIALVEDGCSVLGVVYAPAIDTLYWGGLGLGAWRSTANESVAISVGAHDEASVCRVIASRSHLNVETQELIDHLRGGAQLITAGSSLKFCRIAEGAADLYPRLAPTCEWDTAAGQAVLEGAGGVVLDLQGQPLRYGKTDVLNPSFIAAACASWMPK